MRGANMNIRAISMVLVLCLAVFTGITCKKDKATTTQPKQEGVAVLPAGEKLEGEDCKLHVECKSGVCSYYKADNGYCTSISCKKGIREDNNNFFCNEVGKWAKSKGEGEPCEYDYECYQPTCFMRPNCGTANLPVVSCRNGVCFHEFVENECERQGMKKLLRKDQYSITDDGRCFESMAQMILPTVCAPCGNGICDDEVESKCNCPEDCK